MLLSPFQRSGWNMLAKLALSVAASVAVSTALTAMEVVAVGDQLILSGPVVGDEYDRVIRLLAGGSRINTVVLRNSPGGNIQTGYRLGKLFRTKGIHTAVSGFCYSSCSRMFLGGKQRNFTDDFAAEYTQVGLHGHYDKDGKLLAQTVRQLGLKAWIIRYSDGKADASLVERWINIPRNVGMIHFFHPRLVKRGGYTTFMCQGDERTTNGVFGCEPIAKTAADLGIVTSLAPVHGNDQETIRAAMPAKPPRSGFAAIEDEAKVPLARNGLMEYRRFLGQSFPRAFAIAPGGGAWAWVSGNFNAISGALERCTERAKRACQLYAVDDDVVWKPEDQPVAAPANSEPR
jgi:hypothetical protein